MLRFQIPDFYKPGFEAISKLDKVQLSNILAALRTIKVGVGPEEFTEKLTLKSNVPAIKDIANVLYSFGSIFISDADTANLPEQLTESFYFGQKTSSKAEKKQMQSALSALLNTSENLKMTFKARGLLTDNTNLFREARILSDLRFIFNEDLSYNKRNAVIIHRLKIESYQDGSSKDTYFSLDKADLQKLKKQIERALEKEKFIQSDYKKSINFIEIGE